jgi:phosphatidylinositol alpha-1,6-mannosyltransferase
MKILLLTSEFEPMAGGIATYAREIAAAAARLGAEVTVIAPDYFRSTFSEDGALPFRVRRFRGGLHSMRHLPAKILIARRAVGADTYDVVHAADWPFFIPVALARRRGRAVMMVHGTEINEMQTSAKRAAIRVADVFGGDTEIVANSGFTRDLFLEHFPAPGDRVRAIPLGVSEFWFGPRAERAAVRQRLGIRPDAVVMATVARLTRRKGHLATLAALDLLPDEVRSRLTWLVVGPDGEPDYVAALHATADRSQCDVRFLGRLAGEEIRNIYGASDFFCLTGVPDPSGRVEGFGLVYLEAGACGLPSVATAIGGVAEAVIGERTGLLVAPAAEPIATAIALLATDERRRSTFGRAALEHARALSWERCAAQTYGLPPADDALREKPTSDLHPTRRGGELSVAVTGK